MSDYSCSEHSHYFYEDCAACDAAKDWASQQRRIAELEAENRRLLKHKGKAKRKLSAMLEKLLDENRLLRDELQMEINFHEGKSTDYRATRMKVALQEIE